MSYSWYDIYVKATFCIHLILSFPYCVHKFWIPFLVQAEQLNLGKLTVLKKKQDNRSKTGSLTVNPMSPNQNFITVSVSPTNGLLNQAIRNHLVSANEVICLIKTCHPLKQAVPNIVGTRDQFHGRQFFPRLWIVVGWFGDDSSMLHVLCTLFPSLLRKFHLRSSGIRS